jgi:hypothetical protein
VLSILPRAAELYRPQIAQGLDGNAREPLKARVFLRDWFGGKIRLEPLPDGGLVALWDQEETALLRRADHLVAGACYGLVQYSRFSPRRASAGPSYPQPAAATATNSHPITSCPRNAVPAGAAANAGPIVPLPGVADGRPLLSAQATRWGVPAPGVAKLGAVATTGGIRPAVTGGGQYLARF